MEMFNLFHDNSFQKEHDFELFKNREIKAKSIFSIIDKTLNILYQEKEKPSTTETTKTECCGGTGFVYDKRFGDWFTCPKCSSKFRIVNKEELA